MATKTMMIKPMDIVFWAKTDTWWYPFERTAGNERCCRSQGAGQSGNLVWTCEPAEIAVRPLSVVAGRHKSQSQFYRLVQE
ncbi:MAG: hypothetical protein CMJ75_06605 [Planctomycetaceae bacterium]|nr:hypothetical protein [Planctomycetaceae bacterium]